MNVPLIVDVLPLFEDLSLSLKAIRDDDLDHNEESDRNDSSCDDSGRSSPETEKALPVLRIAAQAALLVVEKYSIFTSECEMYYIAIGKFHL